mgnify:CR=1 FL=1
MKNNHDHPNYLNAIIKKTGQHVSVFLTPQEIHFKNQLTCVIPVYHNNDEQTKEIYVNINELEFLTDVEEPWPSTRRLGTKSK